MKNNKKLKTGLLILLFILIIAIIFGILYAVTFKNNKDKDEEEFPGIDYQAMAKQDLNLKLESLEDNFFDSFNKKNLPHNLATLNKDFAYSVDYGCDAPKSSLSFKSYLSDQGMAVLMNGYPNNTFESMGCANGDEAYLATQMAFWEIMNRTGESEKATGIFRVNNITPVSSANDSYTRVINASKKLVNLAETEPYSQIPTMHIKNGNVNYTVVDETVIIGPYSVEISGDAEFKAITASLVNAPSSAIITDENGVEKSILSNGDTVYVRMYTKENDITFNIRFEAFANRKVGALFEETNKTSQDYAKLYLVPINIEKDLTIEFTKKKTLGIIELVVGDKVNAPVSGSVFNLIDSYGNILMEVTTGKDGVVDFYSIPEGDYTLEQISAPEGYTIKEKSKKVTVTAGELVTVKFEN